MDILGDSFLRHHPLHYQVRFAAQDLAEQGDDLIRRAVEVWRRCEETHTMTAEDLALLQQRRRDCWTRCAAHDRR
ncbi:MAG: hypothetical protein M3425_09595 [Actinomycetota bacterium]|nr:hypothetical protein [Actinomycetota bacterium]